MNGSKPGKLHELLLIHEAGGGDPSTATQQTSITYLPDGTVLANNSPVYFPTE